MLLQNKVAVIHGAGGAIGGAVARAFAREGAKLFLSGRSLAKLERVASDIASSGGIAEAAVVDALDEGAVDAHLRRVVARAGAVDISFSAVGISNVGLQGTPLTELSVENFLRPVDTYLKAHFITARLAARRMLARKSGVILTVTATPARRGAALVGGMAPSWGAIEALTRTLSAELAPHGVRVVGLRSEGMPETGTIDEVFAIHARAHGITWQEFHGAVAQLTHSGRLPTLGELAEAAVFVASDRASAMTGTIVNLNGGMIAD